MVSKNVLILTGILVAGAAVALVVGREDLKKDPRIGKPLLDPAAATTLDRIEVKRGAAAALAVRDESGVWHLGTVTGFPVDATRVSRLIDDAGATTFQMVAGSAEREAADFGLDSPETLTFGAGGKDVAVLRLGKDRKGGGQFVAPADGPVAYLASKTLSVSPDAETWELKTLLTLDKDKIKTIAFQPAGAGRKAATLTREKKEDALKLDVSGPVTFTKRYDAGNEEAKAALAAASKAVVTLFDGAAYTVEVGSIGEKTKKYFLRVSGDKRLDELMAKNAFEVPAYIAQKFDKSQSDVEPQSKG